MVKELIHTYYPGNQLPNIFGLSDFMLGTGTLYSSTVRLGINLFVDYSKHPISLFLDNNHIFKGICVDEINYFTRHFIFNETSIIYYLNAYIKDLLNQKDKVRIITNIYPDKDKIIEADREFVRECFKPNKKLLSCISTVKNRLGGMYNSLQIRGGDLRYERSVFEDVCNKVDRYLKTVDQNIPLFVVSDNKLIRQYVNEKYKFTVSMDSNPIHLGMAASRLLTIEDLDRIRDTLTEMFIFTQSAGVSSMGIYQKGSTGFLRVANTIYNVPILYTELLDWPY